ncbi:uncharacterized protein [Centruroides vittatus]|uniref:uncharacterized protein isoform X1 n=1 Tax=Centruroides vittatus TaxID=120091 RepID=UPI0035103FCF
MTIKTKLLFFLFVSCQLVMLVAQLASLAGTYWTSWHFRYNMTNVDHFGRSQEVESRGHAGLWSRCVKIRRGRETKEECFYNFANATYEFGKFCKIATSAVCVLQSTLNLFLLTVVIATASRKNAASVLRHLRSPLFTLQGTVAATAPLLYVIGNMAELVNHLTTAYNLFFVIEVKVWYVHNWAYWLQVSILYLWIFSVLPYIQLSRLKGWNLFHQGLRSFSRNGGSAELGEISELSTLRRRSDDNRDN